MKHHWLLSILCTVGLIQCATQNPSASTDQCEYFIYQGQRCMQVMERKYISDSVFVDRMWSDSGRMLVRTDTIKLVSNSWYVQSKGKFNLLFSGIDPLSPQKIQLENNIQLAGFGQVEYYDPIGTDTFRNTVVYVYNRYYAVPSETELIYGDKFYFTPSQGFIMISDQYCYEMYMQKVDSIPLGWQLKGK